MKRLVIDARMLSMSGIGRYIRSLLPSVLQIPDTETILMGNPQELVQYTQNIIPLRSRIYHPREQIELRRKIPPCDLFWTPHFNVPLHRIPARKRLVTIHDVFHLSDVAPYNWLEKMYIRHLLRQAIKKSDAIITVSKFTRDEMDFYLALSPVEKTKIYTIYHYVDIPTPLLSEERINEILSHYHITSPYLLYVGNIKPHKNVTGLVKAFNIVHRLAHDLKLVIVGNKENFYKGIPEFESLVLHHNAEASIIFTGKVGDEELSALYQKALTLILPSFYEGFGLPPLEAMSLGCPVILSSLPVFWEIFEDSAYYIDPYSPEEMAEKIYTFYCQADLQESYREKGRERVKLFTKEKNLSTHLQLIQNLLNS